MASDGAARPPAADGERRLEIAAPALGPEEREAVLEVLDGRKLVKGERVEAFENAFANLHGARHGVAVSSGSTALLAALLAHGIGPGDEVIVPSFSFFATAAAVVLAGATPVFADIDAATFCLSPDAATAAVTARTRAVMPVHLFGLPADLPRFVELAERRGLVLLEDAAQAHGASIGGRRVGTFGTAAFSFYATKNMTTLEGGMVLTNDADIARRVRLVRNHGREGSSPHLLVGSNFRLHELGAAIGLVQLARLPGWNAARRANARYLSERLRGVELPVEPPGREHVFQQYTVRAADQSARDALTAHLAAAGITARAYYARPIHEEPALAGRLGHQPLHLPETKRASEQVLSLPIHPGLNEGDLERIARAVNAFEALC
jgi:dTDP-4-amino-4,6-dideoxygalactose transaminase